MGAMKLPYKLHVLYITSQMRKCFQKGAPVSMVQMNAIGNFEAPQFVINSVYIYTYSLESGGVEDLEYMIYRKPFKMAYRMVYY